MSLIDDLKLLQRQNLCRESRCLYLVFRDGLCLRHFREREAER